MQIQEKLNDLIDNDASQEEAMRLVNTIRHNIDVNIQPDIDWIEQDMEGAIELSKWQIELLETYKKTMRMIQ